MTTLTEPISPKLSTTYPEEQILYDRVFKLVQTASSEELIYKFRSLFLDSKNYDEPEFLAALNKIANLESAEEKIRFVISRCCHIVIHHWYSSNPHQFKAEISKLIEMFAYLPTFRKGWKKNQNDSLRELIGDFRKTEQYLKLNRLDRVINSDRHQDENNYLGSLIYRYPFLYEHYLLSEDSSTEARLTVQKLQLANHTSFEFKLSHYVTYKVRISESSTFKTLNKVDNPTLLPEKEFEQAIIQFAGNTEKGYDYKELAKKFLHNLTMVDSYEQFKQELYKYLLLGIDSKYAQYSFQNQLNTKLKNILPDSHRQKTNDFLILRTVNQLLNFLVVDSASNFNHFLLVDLITNLGPSNAVGLLLKLILICPQAKPLLEKKMAMLVSHYESFPAAKVPWLVKSLENLNIALSVYCGKVDLSYVKISKLKS